MARQRWNLNREWQFLRRDVPGAQACDFDHSQWLRIGLPHTFDLPYFRTPKFYVGVGWYRRRFILPTAAQPRRVFLECDGVFQEAEVFVNGRRVGQHHGGYTGFSMDVTDAARAGENLLAVRVNNLWNPRLPPRAGEHIFCGGIYRDVHLLITDPLHVTWYGTFVTTPGVSKDSAMVNAKTEIRNESDVRRTADISTVILDSDRRVIAATSSPLDLAPHATADIEQEIGPVQKIKLWYPDHPHMYAVRTRIRDGEHVIDEYESPLAFRWFQWTADRGFFLNGEHLYLRGANVHQDHAGWGVGITRAAAERDVKLMKDAGFNFIRGAHYPHMGAFAAACDRLGMLFWSENCFWGKGGFGPEGYWNASAYPVNVDDFAPFEANCKTALRELIRIHRNHPSIVAWSMTNEAFFTYNLERAKRLIADLVSLSHQLDPTRPAAIGGAQRGDVDKLGDVAGYNGDGARLFIDPGMPNLVSEYGAISKPHDSFEPFFGELQSEQFPWRSGQAIWAGFDYGSIAGRQGLKGICDHFRLPKQSWHWYRQAYRGIAPPPRPQPGAPAALALTADKQTIRGTDAVDDAQIVVTVLDAAGQHVSNSPPVTLTIESGPGEFPTGPSITFDADTDIKIVSGQAAIAFRSYHGGVTTIRATSPGLADATLMLTTLGQPAFIPGVTPSATPRPYTPPPLPEAAQAAMRSVVNVARDRPSKASSEAEQHPARHANDGLSLHWLAHEIRPGAWWQVDLEGFYQISGSKITFASDGSYRFVIDLSCDGINWGRAVDRSQTPSTAQVRNDIYPPGATARYVRITFHAVPQGQHANLLDVEVYGILSLR